MTITASKLGAALRARFKTPQAALRALGLDAALLDDLRPAKQKPKRRPTRMAMDDADAERKEAAVNIRNFLMIEKGFSEKNANAVLSMMGLLDDDAGDERDAERDAAALAAHGEAMDMPENALAGGGMGGAMSGRNELKAAMDCMRKIAIASPTRELPPMALDRSTAQDADLEKMFPGISRIGIQL